MLEIGPNLKSLIEALGGFIVVAFIAWLFFHD